jgi:hypothetical protein
MPKILLNNVSCVVNCTAPFRVQGRSETAIKLLNEFHFKVETAVFNKFAKQIY